MSVTDLRRSNRFRKEARVCKPWWNADAGWTCIKPRSWACLLMVSPQGKVRKQMRTFGTTTRELLSLRQWLLSEGCTDVAMESTGVCWKPVYAILKGTLEIVIANAQHVKKVPSRKSDVKTRSGWLTCSVTDCCAPALFPRVRSAIGCGSCWRRRTSNWPAWPATSSGSPAN